LHGIFPERLASERGGGCQVGDRKRGVRCSNDPEARIAGSREHLLVISAAGSNAFCHRAAHGIIKGTGPPVATM
jgi:hypothetical protein